MLRLAHLSDPHLGPLPTPRWVDLIGKRITGFLSWHLKRSRIHDPHVLELVVRDIKGHAPDHVALTGDLINLALGEEYRNARRWLGEFGGPDWVSIVPGNHDTYVPMDWQQGFALWADHFTGEGRPPAAPDSNLASRFPYVRFRRNVALIGVSTAIPTWPGMATGLIGEAQLARLDALLRQTRERGFYRVLLLHHPPLHGLAPPRKSLLDSAPLVRLFESEGAELVLYGHNHRHQQSSVVGRHGRVHIIGIPSASQNLYNGVTAAWNLFTIRREDKTWLADMTTRCFDPETDGMITMSTQALTSN